MYWNGVIENDYIEDGLININMRCIEIEYEQQRIESLIEININMRCIEISFKIAVRGKLPEININMRCIEI